MTKKFDATVKDMLEEGPPDWPALIGYPGRQVTIIDSDVATISGAADKVLRIHDEPPWIMHVDFQAGPDRSLPRRTHVYNAVLDNRHGLVVRSVVVLLRPQAQLRNLTGAYQRWLPGETEPYLTFRYQIIRVWELAVESLLEGGPGTLALAPISNVTQGQLPAVLQSMKERLDQPRMRRHANKVWGAAYLLMGLRYESTYINHLIKGVRNMEESTTYQYLVQKGLKEGLEKGLKEGLEEGLEKGRVEGARKIVLHLGERRFGMPASSRALAALEALTSLQQLEHLVDQIETAPGWDELLPSAASRKRKRKNDA